MIFSRISSSIFSLLTCWWRYRCVNEWNRPHSKSDHRWIQSSLWCFCCVSLFVTAALTSSAYGGRTTGLRSDPINEAVSLVTGTRPIVVSTIAIGRRRGFPPTTNRFLSLSLSLSLSLFVSTPNTLNPEFRWTLFLEKKNQTITTTEENRSEKKSSISSVSMFLLFIRSNPLLFL